MDNLQLRLISEGYGINELVDIDKWFAGDLMLKRKKTPRRFEFVSGWEKDDFRYKILKTYSGYLKNTKGNNVATLRWEEKPNETNETTEK